MATACWLLVVAAALVVGCGDDDGGDDTGATGDGGVTDGGVGDGGAGDGGAGDGGASATDIAALLTQTGGCSDVAIWATSADQSWALSVVDDSGMVQSAHDAGTTVTATWDMGMDLTEAPTVRVLQGSDLGVLFCNDVAEPYTIDHEWAMVGGTVTIAVTPTGSSKSPGDISADATLTLTDGVFSASDADDVVISSFETTVGVGWLPG